MFLKIISKQFIGLEKQQIKGMQDQGQYNLGYMYAKGEGVPEDYTESSLLV